MFNVVTCRQPVEEAVHISYLQKFRLLFIKHFTDKVLENIHGVEPEQLEFAQLLDQFADVITF